ncbi:hypothetical protein BaRGS_00012142 [Batillaria attramentaria]|uniref:Uncharacterized protein n=1 Tax=Batillaria attramentaria TaxID=370345 RepID=A0ABD0LAU4_9CAEN
MLTAQHVQECRVFQVNKSGRAKGHNRSLTCGQSRRQENENLQKSAAPTPHALKHLCQSSPSMRLYVQLIERGHQRCKYSTQITTHGFLSVCHLRRTCKDWRGKLFTQRRREGHFDPTGISLPPSCQSTAN